MIRFVDLTGFYWADEDDPENAPCCAFVDTVTDRFVEHDGSQVFDSMDDVEEMGERYVVLLPLGFFAPRASSGA